MATPDPFSTSNTALAAYLVYHRQNYLGFHPEKDNPARIMFVFVKSKEIDKLVGEYEDSDRTAINIREYIGTYKYLSKQLKKYSGENNAKK